MPRPSTSTTRPMRSTTRTAAPPRSDLLARLDGSGVFERVATIERAADIARLIDDRDALLGRRASARISSATSPPASRPTSRSSPTAATPTPPARRSATSTPSSTASTPTGGPAHGLADPPLKVTRARLVQRQSRDELEHDPRPDRHDHAAAGAAADRAVGGARARGRHLRPVAGDADPAGARS